jgi:hypothetical protein
MTSSPDAISFTSKPDSQGFTESNVCLKKEEPLLRFLNFLEVVFS